MNSLLNVLELEKCHFRLKSNTLILDKSGATSTTKGSTLKKGQVEFILI